LDAALADATGLAPGFFDTVAIVFFPVGFGLGAGLFAALVLAILADFTVFLDEGFCWGLRAALPPRLGFALGAFLASFLLAVAFFVLAAFFADMALASKTVQEAAIIQT